MNIIPDIILAAILVIAFIAGYKKGFIQSVWKIAALAVTIVLVIVLKNPAVTFLYGTNFASALHERIAETVNIPSGGGVNIAETLNLPEFMQGDLNSTVSNGVESVNNTAVDYLTGIFLTVIACVALFIIIRLVLMAVYMIINGVSKFPVINGVNKCVGGILMAVNIVFIIFLAFALMSIFAPADSDFYDIINNTYLVKYFYNYNILLQLFMKL